MLVDSLAGDASGWRQTCDRLSNQDNVVIVCHKNDVNFKSTNLSSDNEIDRSLTLPQEIKIKSDI